MVSIRRVSLALFFIVAAGGGTCRAQWFYPMGYGAWGWNGWGGETVQGSIAQGLGVFAAGAGVYNERTAVANSINADTAMRWNQYMWLSQQEANRRYHERLARQQAGRVRGREEVQNRLRNNPDARDISRGDALNVALDEINNPRVYFRTLKAAKETVPGTSIREIPFQRASAAITTSVDQLTRGGPPESLKADAFAAERDELKALAAELRRQNEEKGEYDPATLRKAQDVIHALRVKVEATFPRNTRQRTEAERYLKALFGLTRMLETPAINVLLAGVENRPETNLGELISFMNAFNLRFGVASTPQQQQVYSALFPKLARLRDEAAAALGATAAAEPPSDRDTRPGEFFEGIPIEHLDPKDRKVPTPPGPAATPAPK